MKYLFLISFFVGAFYSSGSAHTPIADAGKHLNGKVSIVDKVYDIRTTQGDAQPMLSLGTKCPSQLLTVIIPRASRTKFAANAKGALKGRIVYVSGKIISFEGKPAITVTDSTQLKVAFTDPMEPNPNSQH